MRKYNKQPLTFENQLERLKDRGLLVSDEHYALEKLSQISYFRLSAYFLPFQKEKDKFNKNVDFKQIVNLYSFDRELRLLVFDCIERIEVAIRTQFIYQMAIHYNDSHWQDNQSLFIAPGYNKKDKTKVVNPFSDFQAVISKAIAATRPEVFIKHYTQNYNEPKNPPSWMCFELLTIGELSRLYRGLKHNEDKKRIAKFFGLYPTVFTSWLHTLTYVRNICAHHSRLWNKDLAVEPEQLKKPVGAWVGDEFNNNKRIFYFLCVLKYLLIRVNPNNSFTEKLRLLFEKYPNVPIQYLGIPSDGKGNLLDWQKQPLWQYSTDNYSKNKTIKIMKKFTEYQLEQAFIQLLTEQGYAYENGKNVVRGSEKEVLLREDLQEFLIKQYPDLEAVEVETIINQIAYQSASNLYESNKNIGELLSEGFIFKRNNPAHKDLHIRYIDVENWENNHFKVVNQLEIQGSEKRIPDLILYINGIPVVVVELKTLINEEVTIHDAFKQLTIRYRRDIPELLKYNVFCIISDGVNSKAGTLFSPYEFFYGWNKITGEEKKALQGIESFQSLIQGMLNPQRLVDIIHHFVLFPDNSKKETKILCRYPQYYAANKLYQNIKLHRKPNGDGKGGTYFGATGCGKSFTMLYLTRLLMRSTDFSAPTIVIISDRNDLDDQLSKDFMNAKKFIGDEHIIQISSREDLREKLRGRESGGVFLTTIQKFSEDTELLSERDNIICISDEAHRSQVNLDLKLKIDENNIKKSYGFAKYLHDSLPNATFVGFTGTPIDKTLEVFGDVVDSYTMFESVNDEITVRLVYEGRAARVNLDTEKVKEIEKYYESAIDEGASEYQVEESKKATTKMEIILGDKDRIKAIAEDFVTHYEKRIEEKATVAQKAMFVCASREIAYKLYKEILNIRPEWEEIKLDENLSVEEKKKIKPIERLKMVMTRNKDDEKELYELLGDKDSRKELDRQFKQEKSNFKIAIVVDMWLTGFDVPFLDTIYIDKPLKTHNLIQTISRVNRKFEGKQNGLVVDYIGIKKRLNEALGLFNNQNDADDFKDLSQVEVIIRDQMELLRQLFHNFDNKSYFNGNPNERLACLQKAADYVLKTQESEKLFFDLTKKLKSAYNLVSGSGLFSEEEVDEIHFYFAVKSIIAKLTKGDAPDTEQMNQKVLKMVEEAIISQGVEEIFKIDDNKANAIDLFNDTFIEKISALELPNTKIRILERLLKENIATLQKVNKIKGVQFSERLQGIVNKYNERSEADTAEQMIDLIFKLQEELKPEGGVDYQLKAFYDILEFVQKKHGFDFDPNKMWELAKEIKQIVENTTKYPSWRDREDLKAQLKMGIIVKLHQYKYPPITQEEVYKEVLEQAENFKRNSDGE